MASEFETFIKRGDTPTKQWQVNDDLDAALTVEMVICSFDGVQLMRRAVDDHVGSIVTVTFTEEETANVGDFRLEVETTWPEVAGTITYPERGYLTLHIVQDLC